MIQLLCGTYIGKSLAFASNFHPLAMVRTETPNLVFLHFQRSQRPRGSFYSLCIRSPKTPAGLLPLGTL